MRKTYSKEVKVVAVHRYLAGESYKQIAEDIQIKNTGQLKRWTRKFRESGEEGLEDQRGRHGNQKGRPKTEANYHELNGVVSEHASKKVREKYKIIKELKEKYPVDALCKALNVSRSGYYKYLLIENNPDHDAELKKVIEQIYHEQKGTYGYKRISLEIRKQGRVVNGKKVYRLMKELGLKGKFGAGL